MAKFWKKITEHPILTTTVAILLFIAAIWPVFISHETIPDYLAQKGWAVNMPPWYYIFALTLGCFIVVLQVVLIRAVRASKKEITTGEKPRNLIFPTMQELLQPSIPFPPGLFEIEILEGELHWRDAGKKQLVPFTPDPDGQTPDTATVVLALYVRITAIPAQLLEEMQLSIMSQLLSPSLNSWHSTEISGERPYFFYFDIPPSLSHGPHFVHLVATTSLHGIIHQSPSSPFEIVLARTYQQLHRFRPQQFPLPS